MTLAAVTLPIGGWTLSSRKLTHSAWVARMTTSLQLSSNGTGERVLYKDHIPCSNRGLASGVNGSSSMNHAVLVDLSGFSRAASYIQVWTRFPKRLSLGNRPLNFVSRSGLRTWTCSIERPSPSLTGVRRKPDKPPQLSFRVNAARSC